MIDGRRLLHPAAWGRERFRHRRAVLLVHSFFLSGFCISFGLVEPLDIFALSVRANPGMPISTRQQAEEEERAATAVALREAQGQAEQFCLC